MNFQKNNINASLGWYYSRGGQFVQPDVTKNHWYEGPGPESVYKWQAEVHEEFAQRADWLLP